MSKFLGKYIDDYELIYFVKEYKKLKYIQPIIKFSKEIVI